MTPFCVLKRLETPKEYNNLYAKVLNIPLSRLQANNSGLIEKETEDRKVLSINFEHVLPQFTARIDIILHIM